MMRLDITESDVCIRHGDRLAGVYHHRHAYKPHLHPLYTPGGHGISLDNPHDHRHHRGLFYGLKCEDCSFYEEAGDYGVQRHVGFGDDTIAEGETVRFTHLIEWRRVSDDAAFFSESRRIACRHDAENRSYRWSWSTRLEAKRAVELVKSPHSRPDATGTPINYHGLGIRFRRDFSGCPAWYELQANNETAPIEAVHGKPLGGITWIGRIDGTLPIERAAFTLIQHQDFSLFALADPFAFLSFGPTNLEPKRLETGESLSESYEAIVGDAPPLGA